MPVDYTDLMVWAKPRTYAVWRDAELALMQCDFECCDLNLHPEDGCGACWVWVKEVCDWYGYIQEDDLHNVIHLGWSE